jgi:hypothetical protein
VQNKTTTTTSTSTSTSTLFVRTDNNVSENKKVESHEPLQQPLMSVHSQSEVLNASNFSEFTHTNTKHQQKQQQHRQQQHQQQKQQHSNQYQQKQHKQQQQQQQQQQQPYAESDYKTTAKASETVFLVFPLNSESVELSQVKNELQLDESTYHPDHQSLLLVYPQDFDDENFAKQDLNDENSVRQNLNDDNFVRQDFNGDNFVRQTRQLNQTLTTVQEDDNSCYVQTCDQTITGRQLSYSRLLLYFFLFKLFI